MLGSEPVGAGAGPGADADRVVQEFRERVLPCGVDAVNRLETAVEEKLAEARTLAETPPERFAVGFRAVVDGVVSARPHRAEIVARSSPAAVREILEGARVARLGPGDLLGVADRLAGAPRDVRVDVASELLHAGAPDRLGLLARWVWNPERRTGILAVFGGPPPETYPGVQARLGELRLGLGAAGFPSSTFAAVDVLLALSYSARMNEAVDRSFQGGGIERLLPGSFPLAAMVLGVRRRMLHADR